MLEAALSDIVGQAALDLPDLTSRLLAVGDDELLRTFAAEATPGGAGARLLHGLTGDRRRLYKRLGTWSRVDATDDRRATYEQLYALDAERALRLTARLSERLGARGRPLPPGALLLDVPPRDKDAIPDVAVHHVAARRWTTLAASSRIVHGIAHDFVKVVKKIRLFIHPEYAALTGDVPRVEALVAELVAELSPAASEAPP